MCAGAEGHPRPPRPALHGELGAGLSAHGRGWAGRGESGGEEAAGGAWRGGVARAPPPLYPLRAQQPSGRAAPSSGSPRRCSPAP